MERPHHRAGVPTESDVRTEVHRLADGRVELQHLQFGEGLGWYTTQRAVMTAEAAAELRATLGAVLAPPPTTTRPDRNKVVYLADRRAK